MMLDKLGLKSIFYVPAAIMFGQVVITFWLARRVRVSPIREPVSSGNLTQPLQGCDPLTPQSQSSLGPSRTGQHSATLGFEAESLRDSQVEPNPRPIAKAKWFLRMAWLANPFAYIALNTVIAVVPGVANKLGLSATMAGFCCSVWCFARFAAFFGLWAWSGWHYRFRWLLTAYLALLATFALIVLAPNLAVLVAAQIIFGGALGLIYYSSLFYSMDLSERRANTVEYMKPQLASVISQVLLSRPVRSTFCRNLPAAGVVGVCVLLVGGLAGLIVMRGRMR